MKFCLKLILILKTYNFTYVYHENQLMAQNANGVRYYLHPDHLGSTRLVTDQSGAVVENTFYSPFGEALVYYDWALSNLYWIKDAYKIPDLEETTPNIILIAPEFSTDLINEVKYLGETISILLLTFNAFKINGKIEVVFNILNTPEISELQDKTKGIEDHYEFITNSTVKEILKWTQDEISKWSTEIKPHAKNGVLL